MRRAVIIVGAGPAGAATALRLIAREPSLAGDVLLLDKARHPRDKTCAGGLIPKSIALLRELGVTLERVPQARVDAAAVLVPRARLHIDAPDACRVVRRCELDAELAWTARARGAELREGEHVIGLARDGDGIRVETTTGTWWAPVVVGADGSGSVVRRTLVPGPGGVVGRAVMTDVPVADTTWDGRGGRRYDFDFRGCPSGLRGYAWAFPCLVAGVPHVNVGAYGLPPVGGALLQRELAATLRRIGATARAWKAFPIRTWTSDAALAAPHVLLAGDAAGVDPLMGEGISFALEYGVAAAETILAARRTGDWTFAGYARDVREGPLGRKLRRLEQATRLFYGRRGPLWFGLARASRRAQRLGLAWYNGSEGWDVRGRRALLRELVWPRSAGMARA